MGDTIYAPLIRDMTWSFSRANTFANCPYKFYLRYIMQRQPSEQFFASYGGFVHKLFERYYTGELKKDELPSEYLLNFSDEVHGKPMSQKVFRSYFDDGLRAMREFEPITGKILGVEEHVNDEIDGVRFTGIVDLVVEDGDGLSIVDHKSRALKPLSGKEKPTKNDKDIDSLLTQLYLYVPLVERVYGRKPEQLCINSFRTGNLIKTKFDNGKFEAAKAWLRETVDKIATEEDFDPEPDYFKCHNLCEMCEHCEYIDYI